MIAGGQWLSPRAARSNTAVENSVASLSDRELETFELIGAGFSTREIAERLQLSPKTIECYRENIKRKLLLDSCGHDAARDCLAASRAEVGPCRDRPDRAASSPNSPAATPNVIFLGLARHSRYPPLPIRQLFRSVLVALDSLADAFYDELCDIYHAEKQLLKALPKMAKRASSEALAEAFRTHLAETATQVERVERAFKDTDKAAKAKKCEAMAGLIEEASEMMQEDADPEVMDAVLISCAQKVEHYEIATYGTLCTWADVLGYKAAKSALAENLKEEELADKKLTKISTKVNKAAKE